MLTIDTAQRLLAPIAGSPVHSVQHISNTNDVFKVVTERHGNFYVKFHTSPWYKDAADTEIVVRREAAVLELLRRKGISLNYQAWTDVTRSIVSRSVLITSELPGVPLPDALKECPEERDQIIAALARFLRRLHDLTFPRAGYIECSGDPDLPFTLDPAENGWFDSHPCQKPENLKAFALQILVSKAAYLPGALFSALKERFEALPAITGADYTPPRFVINNYHPQHIHVQREPYGWGVTGLYDFEAVSAGSPTLDLVGNELQLAPLMGGLAWRPLFYTAYGRWPAFEAFKTTLLPFLLLGLGREPAAGTPDPDGLVGKLSGLLNTEDYDGFGWYPS